MRIRRTTAPVIALVIALAASPAEAHLNSTGMGPIYDGMAHFLRSPEDLVATIALAMLAGLRGAACGRRLLFTLPTAWLVGIMIGATRPVIDAGPAWTAFWFLLLGGLVVADARISLRMITALGMAFGLGHGFLNGTGLGISWFGIVASAGLASAVFLSVALVAAFVGRLRAPWTRIAVRVVGSWIMASGLLLLGWSLRGGA